MTNKTENFNAIAWITSNEVKMTNKKKTSSFHHHNNNHKRAISVENVFNVNEKVVFIENEQLTRMFWTWEKNVTWKKQSNQSDLCTQQPFKREEKWTARFFAFLLLSTWFQIAVHSSLVFPTTCCPDAQFMTRSALCVVALCQFDVNKSRTHCNTPLKLSWCIDCSMKNEFSRFFFSSNREQSALRLWNINAHMCFWSHPFDILIKFQWLSFFFDSH